MSSGDMTTYIRGKQEERGNTNDTFMLDGFDRWAESDAPNRVGGMYKEPAERTHRRRRGRGLDRFDSESDSDSCESEGYGRHRRSKRRGGARGHISDSSDSSGSSDSSDFSETETESENEMVGGSRGPTQGDYEYAKKVIADFKLCGSGRRRRHRKAHKMRPMSDSESDESASENESMERRAGGNLPNIVQYADQAQQGYEAVKGVIPSAMKSAVKPLTDFADKVFSLYNTIKSNATMFKKVLESVQGEPNHSSALKVKDKLEQLGFGRMPRRKTLSMMKDLDSKNGTKAHKLLKKMFGAGWLSDKAYELGSPFYLGSTAKAAVDGIIKSSSAAAKFDKFVDAGVDMYNNVKANMPLIRSAMTNFKAKVPAASASIDKVDGALKTVGLGRKGKRQPSQRNMMVSKLMREKGLSLGEASKQVSAMLKKGGEL
jgi:hypothetical protein